MEGGSDGAYPEKVWRYVTAEASARMVEDVRNRQIVDFKEKGKEPKKKKRETKKQEEERWRRRGERR